MAKRKAIKVIVPPVQLSVKIPFFDGTGVSTKSTHYGEQVTFLHANDKSMLIERLRHATQFIAQTENDHLGGGVVAILRFKAKSDKET